MYVIMFNAESAVYLIQTHRIRARVFQQPLAATITSFHILTIVINVMRCA